MTAALLKACCSCFASVTMVLLTVNFIDTVTTFNTDRAFFKSAFKVQNR